MMKLYWSPRSPFVRKVMVCAHELGVIDRIETVYALVSMSKVNPEVMRVNPVGRIPALVTDDGLKLYDSHVICEYLDARYGESRLFRGHTEARWDALRRLALGDALLETLVLWRSEQTRPASQQSPAVLEAFERKAASALAALELEDRSRHVAAVDIGDIAIGCALGYLDFRYAALDWRPRAPRSATWFESFNARTSMQQTLPYEE
jgi:glutathione S-transferase